MATETTDKSVSTGHTRRDFVTLAGQAFAAVGGAVALWPFIQQMNPDASTQALASVEIDLAPIKEGQAATFLWRGKPVFVRNRTKDEIAKAGAVRQVRIACAVVFEFGWLDRPGFLDLLRAAIADEDRLALPQHGDRLTVLDRRQVDFQRRQRLR